MYSIGEDETRYELPIQFSLQDGIWKLETYPSLWIRNEFLPDGRFYAYGGEYNVNLLELRILVKNKYCFDMNPSADDLESTLDNIAKGISVTEYRESKLNKILNAIKFK